MLLIAHSSSWRQDKGASHNDTHEWQAKHEKRVLVHDVAVPHGDSVHVGRGPELFTLKHHSCGLGVGQLAPDRSGRIGIEEGWSVG